MSASLWANEATIRANLPKNAPKLPKIDEIRPTPIKGIFEVRVNDIEIFYTDANGDFLLQGSLYDLKNKVDLTEERVNKLTAIDFAKLPLQDAFTVVRGNGKRKMAIFEDPNCGYCKRIERDLAKLNNITMYVFLYPVLGPDSIEKSRSIWCAKDKAKAFDEWMRNEATPVKGSCDTSAIDRNIKFGKKYHITGTPTLLFANGNRVPGAIGLDQIEKLLQESTR